MKGKRRRLSRKHAVLLLVLFGAAVAPFVLIRGKPPAPATVAANPVPYDDVVKGFADGDFVFEEKSERWNGRPQYVGNNLIDQYTKVYVQGEKSNVRMAHVAVEFTDAMRQYLADPSVSIDDIDKHRAERRLGYMLRLIRNVSPSPQSVEVWMRESLRTHPEKSREDTFRDGTLIWGMDRMPEKPSVWKFQVLLQR